MTRLWAADECLFRSDIEVKRMCLRKSKKVRGGDGFCAAVAAAADMIAGGAGHGARAVWCVGFWSVYICGCV